MWFYRCDKKAFPHNEHLVVPDNTVELIISNDMLFRSFPGKKDTALACSTHLCGVKTVPQLVSFDSANMIGIRFKPFGLYKFIPHSLHEITDRIHDPADLFGKDFHELADRILQAPGPEQRVKLAEQYFLRKMNRLNTVDDELLNGMIGQLLLKKGLLPISELSREFSISPKTIKRKFMAKVGMNPKKYARLIRFRHVLEDYFHHRPARFSELVYNHGYFDQMHFIRETSAFTGSTPGRYFNGVSKENNIQIMMLQHGNTTGQ